MKNTLLFTYSTNVPVCLLTVNMKKVLTPEKSENVQPHSSYSIENVAPLKSIQSLKCDPIQGHIPISLQGSTPPTRSFRKDSPIPGYSRRYGCPFLQKRSWADGPLLHRLEGRLRARACFCPLLVPQTEVVY